VATVLKVLLNNEAARNCLEYVDGKEGLM